MYEVLSPDETGTTFAKHHQWVLCLPIVVHVLNGIARCDVPLSVCLLGI